jgi:hypothetical protein
MCQHVGVQGLAHQLPRHNEVKGAGRVWVTAVREKGSPGGARSRACNRGEYMADVHGR